eukprot:scaffold13901_cov71-Isochrysis_galbana.AAC.1
MFIAARGLFVRKAVTYESLFILEVSSHGGQFTRKVCLYVGRTCGLTGGHAGTKTDTSPFEFESRSEWGMPSRRDAASLRSLVMKRSAWSMEKRRTVSPT